MDTGNSLDWAPIIVALAAAVAALAAVGGLLWQINREIRSVRQKELEVRRAAKMKIISDLVAHRFVLANVTSKKYGQEAELAFNTALSRIPTDFIEHNEVLIKYHEVGNSFTAEKFHDLIKTMLEAAGHRVPKHFTIDLLKTVPTKSICVE